MVRIPEDGYALKRYGSGALVLEEEAGQTGPSYLRKGRTFFLGSVFVQIVMNCEKEHITRQFFYLARLQINKTHFALQCQSRYIFGKMSCHYR